MIRFFCGLYVVVLGIVTGLTFQSTQHPPHVAPPVAEVLGAVPLAAVGGDVPGEVIAQFYAWIEAQREAEAVAAARSVVRAPVVISGDCAGFVLPAEIVWRESKCQRLGDSGNGYFGAYQIGAMHWGPGGLCADLSWDIPAEEDECALRLWNDGAGARHWGA